MEDTTDVYRILADRLECETPLGSARCEWEDAITCKMELREWGYKDMDWIQVAQDRGHWRAVESTAPSLHIGSDTM
jgi:hypothetical protein